MDGLLPMNLPSGYSASRSPFLWNPVGVRNFFLFLPSVRYATLGFGVQRRWRRRKARRLEISKRARLGVGLGRNSREQPRSNRGINPLLQFCNRLSIDAGEWNLLLFSITITINFSTYILLPSSFSSPSVVVYFRDATLAPF